MKPELVFHVKKPTVYDNFMEAAGQNNMIEYKYKIKLTYASNVKQ